MDTTRIDAMTRRFDDTMTRRGALRALVAGAAALVAGQAGLAAEDAAARRRRRNKNRGRKRKEDQTQELVAQPNVCDGRNWCADRTQTCGPAGGYGKCLVEASGGNLCAEILFQVASCTECAAPNCLNCRCVPAVGGADRCNNGANGYDFICVREV